MSPPVGLGFEPDADDEDHLIKSLIAHVYKTLGSIALRPNASRRNTVSTRDDFLECRIAGRHSFRLPKRGVAAKHGTSRNAQWALAPRASLGLP